MIITGLGLLSESRPTKFLTEDQGLTMKFAPLILLTAVSSLCGCATLTRGTTENLSIQTEPAGATATLSSGHMCKTPCVIELKRKNNVHVKLEKSGYETVDTDVNSEIAGAGAAGMAGNVLLGGIIGAGVDAATGATKRLNPNPLVVKMNLIVQASQNAVP